MKRRLFNAAAGLSTALLLAVLVFCVRAQFGMNDYLEWRADNGPLPSEPETLRARDAEWQAFAAAFEAWDRRRWAFHIRANPDAIFAFGRQPFYGYPRNSFGIHLYYWVLIPVLAILPLVWARTLLRTRWNRAYGHCINCGYDLRASSERCPECGMVVAVGEGTV
jgi:hypothetical protein